MRNAAAFINFSCSPNLEVRRIAGPSGDARLPRVGFFARVDIRMDEELSYTRDRNSTSKKSRDHGVPCACGSDKCMGFV